MRIRSAAALVAFTLAACGGDKSTGPGAAVTGSYALQSVNGTRVPVLIVDNGANRQELLSGSVVLNPDKSFTESITFRVSFSGTAPVTSTISCKGTYTQSGNSLTLSESVDAEDSCGGTFPATFSNGNTLTLVIEGISLVYLK